MLAVIIRQISFDVRSKSTSNINNKRILFKFWIILKMFKKPLSQIIKEASTKKGRDNLMRDMRKAMDNQKLSQNVKDAFSKQNQDKIYQGFRKNFDQQKFSQMLKNSFSKGGQQNFFQNVRRNMENLKGFYNSPRRQFGNFENYLRRLPRPVWQYVVGVNVALYLAWNTGFLGQNFLLRHFALSRPNIENSHYHTYLTYSISHENFIHLLFNMATFFFFGRFIETYFGSRTLLQLWLVGSLTSGVFINSVNTKYGNNAPTIGASGAISSILAFYILSFPHQHIYLYFFPVKAWQLGAVMFAWSLFTSGGPNGAASAGHLGGMLAGAGMYMHRRGWKL